MKHYRRLSEEVSPAEILDQVDADDTSAETFVIWPHRSLSATGFVALITSAAIGFSYTIIASRGYQYLPVVSAALITFLALGLALWRDASAALMQEVIEVTPNRVRVSYVGRARPRDPVDFNAFWVRLRVTTDYYVEDRITLAEGRRRKTVGDLLSPEERRDLAAALQKSIKRQTTTLCN